MTKKIKLHNKQLYSKKTNLFVVKEGNPPKDDEQLLAKALKEYGRREISGKPPETIGAFLCTSQKETVGGVIGRMVLGHLYISRLWIDYNPNQ